MSNEVSLAKVELMNSKETVSIDIFNEDCKEGVTLVHIWGSNGYLMKGISGRKLADSDMERKDKKVQ
ncbi:hypothetical protein NST21_25130 [Peribacillus sp. FSL K6-1552]|uniref:hypothetical protein n=1 Tax=Peribacillus sp. FSL K6-1552 TaxID=2954514 RepID=UPI0030F9CC1D